MTKQKTEYTGRVRITRRPDGEAPEWVRQAWVDLELPCDSIVGYPDGGMDRGVITQAPVTQNESGVSVPQDLALAVLHETDPNAAAWWRAYGFPRPDEYFGFEEDEFEILEGVSHQRLIHMPEEMMGHRDR